VLYCNSLSELGVSSAASPATANWRGTSKQWRGTKPPKAATSKRRRRRGGILLLTGVQSKKFWNFIVVKATFWCIFMHF